MTDPDPNILKSAAAYLVQVVRSSKGGRYRKSAKIDAPEGTFNPLAQVQFGQGAFPEFSQCLLLTNAFEDEDSGSTELAEVLPAISSAIALAKEEALREGGSTTCQTSNAKHLVRMQGRDPGSARPLARL